MTERPPEQPIRVLVIPDKYLPDECAGGAIYADMCRGLAARGFDMTVRCPYPFYPEWTDKSGRNGPRIERTLDEGVRLERFGMFIPRDPRSAWQRMLLDATFFGSLLRSLPGGGRFDVVIALCPHIGGLAFGVLNKWLFGSRLCLSVMDLPADAALATGITRKGWLPPLLSRVQATLFNRADVWRSISPVMIERLKGLRRRAQPLLLVPDWLHPTLSSEVRRWPSKVGRPPGRPLRLFYSGNIGTKQGLLDFCQALHASPSPFSFRIQGSGGNAATVRDWVATAGDDRFSFGPLVDEPGFIRSLHETDLFVITEKAGAGSSFFPSKTIPGIATGTPILAVSDPESPLGQEVRGQGLGPWFSWERLGAVGGLLSSLATCTEEFTEWQGNALHRAQFFERERCLDLIESTVRDMAQSRTRALPKTSAALTPSPTH